MPLQGLHLANQLVSDPLLTTILPKIRFSLVLHVATPHAMCQDNGVKRCSVKFACLLISRQMACT